MRSPTASGYKYKNLITPLYGIKELMFAWSPMTGNLGHIRGEVVVMLKYKSDGNPDEIVRYRSSQIRDIPVPLCNPGFLEFTVGSCALPYVRIYLEKLAATEVGPKGLKEVCERILLKLPSMNPGELKDTQE